MRIAFVSSEYSGLPGNGGIGTYFHQSVKCLSALGHELEVFTAGFEGDLPPVKHVRYIHLGNEHPDLFRLKAALALRERHRNKPFDVLEYAELKAEGWLASELVPEIARVVRIHAPSIILNRYLDFPRSKIKMTTDIINNLRAVVGAIKLGIPIPPIAFEPVNLPWPSGADFEERRAAHSADLVVVMSEEMRTFVTKHWWINPEKIKKLANPLTLQGIGETSKPLPSSDTGTIGFAGRLEPRKGLLELAQALQVVLPRYPHWKVEIKGRDVPSCISGASSMKMAQPLLRQVQDRVFFMQEATHQDVLAWLPKLDIVVFPSLWDNFPYAILEAMAAGCAIVASNTGAVAEMLGPAGILVPPRNISALRKALIGLMEDPSKRVRLGELAKQRFQHKFAPSRVANDMVLAYQTAIEWASRTPRA